MKDLVALQMTRRQPVLSYDSNKPKIPAQANRQVRYNHITRNQTFYSTVGLTVDSVHSMNEKLNTRVEICFKIKQLRVFKLCLIYITIPFNIQESLEKLCFFLMTSGLSMLVLHCWTSATKSVTKALVQVYSCFIVFPLDHTAR